MTNGLALLAHRSVRHKTILKHASSIHFSSATSLCTRLKGSFFDSDYMHLAFDNEPNYTFSLQVFKVGRCRLKLRVQRITKDYRA